MSNSVTNKIYEYDNYRFFLRDYFHEQKSLKDTFSHRFFARKAGFASSSFFSHVIDGKRGLTEKSLSKMLKGLGLRGKKATFFRDLVLYNQANCVAEREVQFRKLERTRKSTDLYSLDEHQHAYYDEWYYPVIRELAISPDWSGDFAKLGMLVTPVIQPEKVKQAVEVLCKINILKKRDDGSYEQVNEAVTSQNIPHVVTRKSRREFIKLAERAMEDLPVEERLIAGCTVSMGEQKFFAITEKLNEIRELILDESLEGKDDKKRVYQYNFQAFPLSKEISFSDNF